MALLCMEFQPLYVDLRPLCVDLTPHITKPHSLNNDFLWGLRGALFTRNTNNTNNKQHVNRGYDSESATYSENPAYGWCLISAPYIFGFLPRRILCAIKAYFP